MTISKKDLRLLLYVGGILVFVLVYFTLFSSMQEKNEQKESENRVLNAQLDQLMLLDTKKEEYQATTTKMQDALKEIWAEFPSEFRAEDGVAYVSVLEADKELTINGVSIGDKTLLHTLGQTNIAGMTQAENTTTTAKNSTQEQTTENPTEDAAETNTEAGSLNQEDNQQAKDSGTYLYGQNFTYQFIGSYTGLKQALDELLKDENKKSIEAISASYDNETGLLIGTISVNSYSLAGTEEIYEPVYLPSMNQGQSNLFGTVTLPQSQEETEQEETEE